MNHSRLKGEGGEMRSENLDGLDERDLPVKLKVAIFFLNNLSDLLKREQFCDLEFEVNGNKFQAHRLVLAIWSPVMMNMLTVNSCKTERIQLMYDQPEAFQQFISFLYTGIFDGNVVDVLAVLLLASTFQISLLRDVCEEHFLQTVTVSNVIGLFHISVHYRLTCLEWQCADYIRQHLPEVAQHSEMRDLNAEQMNAFLGSEHMSKLDPEMKLFLLISWLTEDVSNRQQFLVMLLGHIDWSSVADDFLVDISQTDNFFTSHPSSLYLLLQTLHSSSISLGPYTERFDQLREEYNYLLNSVVDSSVHLGMGKLSHFQPITLSILSNSRERSTTNCVQIENESDIAIGEDHHNFEISDLHESSIYRNSSGNEDNIVQNEILTVSKSVEENGEMQPEDIDSLNNSKSSKDSCEGSMKRKRVRPKKLIPGPENVIFSRFNSPRKARNVAKDCAKDETKDDNRIELSDSEDSCHSTELSQNYSQQDSRKQSKAKTVKGKHSDKKLIKDGQRIKKTQLKRKREIDFAGVSEPGEDKLVSKKGRPRKVLEHSRYPCMDCSYVSVSHSLLDKHIKQVHRSNRVFKCSLCQYECKWNKNYKEHLKSAHFNGPPFTCDYQGCSYSANKLNALMAHRRNHADDRPFVCDICRMSFRSRRNLHSHLKCHDDEKKYKCPVCGRCFKLKNTLDQHVVTHDDLRPYLCDLCGFSTKYQSHLISHKKKHTGDVFPCTFPSCTYATPKRSQLKAHMRSHLGIRNHVCGTCGKAFIEKSHLLRHERIHSSVKNHKCSICDYASNRADKLREHMNKHQRSQSTPKAEAAKKKKKKQPSKITELGGRKTETESRNLEVSTRDNDTNGINMSHIYITSVRSGDDLTQEQMAKTMDADEHSSSTVNYLSSAAAAVGELNSSKGIPDDQSNSSPTYEDDVNLRSSSAENQDRNSNQLGGTTATSLSAKQEKDLSAMDLLAHIGLSMADIPSSTGEHHHHQHMGSISTGQFPTNLATGENPLSELTEIMLPGIDMSSSMYGHHPSIQPPSSLILPHSQQSSYLTTLSVPTHSNKNFGCAFPKKSQDHHHPHHHHDHHHHQHQFHPPPPHHHEHSDTPTGHSPHPLIMVPNINSVVVTRHPHSSEDASNPHPLEMQRGHRQSSAYTQCDHFSY